MSFSGQPEVNIGMIGHVDHGKTTLTQRLTGKWTDEHSEEIKRGISIRLGYADAVFYKCPKCPEPRCYTNKKTCPYCGSKTEVLRMVSFLDAPGHETLMAVMLSGASLMDGAILLIAANEKCPQPQTREHLMAMEISGIKNIIIVQNKIDLVSEKEAERNYREIIEFVKGTCAEGAPVIPVSAHHDINIDVLIQAIEKKIPTPDRDLSKDPIMYVARSFDVNKPGTRPDDLKGGVVGGSLIQGVLSIGDEIEIAPGRKLEKERGWDRIITEITSIFTGGKQVEKAGPGGLLAIGTKLDPTFTKSDGFVGRIVGKPGSLPEPKENIRLTVHLLERAVGTVDEKKVEPIKTNEPLMLTVGTATTVGVTTEAYGDTVAVNLKIPVCTFPEQKIAISRRVEGRWRLIGYGIVQK
ncbi:MAG: translation initiation factor IF-2 subunit gamma [Thermoplasmata archaeon]|nr:MAG: translation initiation factor IF-2 subunit gamma [Thermoplasmata archaeon]RLF46124.1 MAG: translation initiation factor IF-2 subunit gamma [Thermoplasmata archaeon]HDD57480.1 translation initiation factor IF-2 subunit gamma [Thermoplasmatales archaeon]